MRRNPNRKIYQKLIKSISHQVMKTTRHRKWKKKLENHTSKMNLIRKKVYGQWFIYEWLVGENNMGKKDKGKWERREEKIRRKYNQREKRSYNWEREREIWNWDFLEFHWHIVQKKE